MLTLKENPTIIDYQNYVSQLELERGFNQEGVLPKCLLLGEEVGELYEGVIGSAKEVIGEELADIIIVLFAVINRFDINLEEQFRENGLTDNIITIPALQKYAKLVRVQKENTFAQCLALGQGVGRLYKAIRKQNNVTRVDSNSKIVSIQKISAEIMLVLCQIANSWDIDLEQSFRDKEEINKQRIWQ